MENMQQLTEIEDALVRYLESQTATKEELMEEFTSKLYPKRAIKDVIRGLEKMRGYIALSGPVLKTGVYSLESETTDDDFEHVYELTALGKAYLARSTSNFTSYSNISGSNIAHNSSNVTQTIKITDQPKEIQEKIKEFDEAVKERDGDALKKAFAYIADKSVDVAIALGTGALVR